MKKLMTFLFIAGLMTSANSRAEEQTVVRLYSSDLQRVYSDNEKPNCDFETIGEKSPWYVAKFFNVINIVTPSKKFTFRMGNDHFIFGTDLSSTDPVPTKESMCSDEGVNAFVETVDTVRESLVRINQIKHGDIKRSCKNGNCACTQSFLDLVVTSNVIHSINFGSRTVACP